MYGSVYNTISPYPFIPLLAIWASCTYSGTGCLILILILILTLTITLTNLGLGILQNAECGNLSRGNLYDVDFFVLNEG